MKHLLMRCIVCAAVVLFIAWQAMAQSPWTTQTSGTTQTLRALKVVSDKVVWAGGMLGVVLRTVDGGTTWQLKTPPDAAYDNYEIEAVDSATAWVCGTNDAGLGLKIWKTTNGGTSWAEQYSNPNSYGDGLAFFDANNGIALGDAEPARASVMVIVRTTNGGSTWTQVPAASIPAVDSANTELSATNDLVLTGSIAWFCTYGGSSSFHPRVFKSTDKGLTWTASPRIAIDDAFAFTMKDSVRGIISNVNSGSIARTSNGWATADSNLLFNGTYGLRSNSWIAGTNSIVIVGGPTATGFSATSVDGGNTWTQRALPAGVPRLRYVRFISLSVGWAVGNSGAIVKWTGPALVSVREPDWNVPSEFTLTQNYPNPFNPVTQLRYAIPRTVAVDVTVYDVLGHAVAVLAHGEHAPGTYTVEFDGSRLASGVYFCIMKAGDFTSTRSLVLVR